MINLDNLEEIKKLDKSNMLGSIEAFPDQCLQAWEEAPKIMVPPDYSNVKNIVVAGMGGSALGAHLIQSLYQNNGLKVPLQIVHDYHLPSYAGENTLVLLSSYSGGTEETLSCAQEALQKRAKILGITTGGKLGEFLTQNNLPGYIFDPKFNPCGQPRIGLGYSILGQMALFGQAGILSVKHDEVANTIKVVKEENEKLKEKAKAAALKIKDKIPIIIAAEFLSGNAHSLANQLNENAKAFGAYFLLPELNHHLLEGLKNPPVAQNLVFIFLNSPLYSEKIQKRLNLTMEVVAKNGLNTMECVFSEGEKLSAALVTLLYGSYLSFFLSLSYKQDPSPIPWVDFFKEKLS